MQKTTISIIIMKLTWKEQSMESLNSSIYKKIMQIKQTSTSSSITLIHFLGLSLLKYLLKFKVDNSAGVVLQENLMDVSV